MLADGGTARRTAVEKKAADVGGRILSFDFAFGGRRRLRGVGAFRCDLGGRAGDDRHRERWSNVRTIVLITAEEIDAAAHRTVVYTPPGG